MDGAVEASASTLPDATVECVSPANLPVVRKSFLTLAFPYYWGLSVSIVSATPNVDSLVQGRTAGADDTLVIASDHLQLVESVEEPSHDPTVLDSWSIANVNASSGCVTSEGGAWQGDDWITWSFDKTDLSDLDIFSTLPAWTLPACVTAATDVHTALVPGSFVVGTAANAPPTVQWSESITGTIACSGESTELSMVAQFVLTRQVAMTK